MAWNPKSFCSLVVLLAINISVANCEEVKTPNELALVGGKLMIKANESDEMVVTLNGKVLKVKKQNSEKDFAGYQLTFDMQFKFSKAELVVLSDSPGGNFTSATDIWFLEVSKNNYRVSGPYEVPCSIKDTECSKVLQNGDSLQISMIERDGRRKKTKNWIYANGELK